jgi:hypothetical protein
MHFKKERLMRLFSILLMVLLLSACADSHQLMRMGGNLRKLDPNGTVYVSVPSDGRYGQTTYYGSAQNVVQIVVLAFSQYSERVESGYEHQEFDASLDAARKLGAMYLVVPTILDWEDRATEWSGIPDKASIKLAVVDVGTRETVDSVIIKGKSGLATFGGDHPQDLLPKPVSEYVKSIY